jgi:hypothetical protein
VSFACLGVAVVACSTTVGVKDVYLSVDQDGARKRAEFFTDSDSIYCVVELSSARSGVTLDVLIRQISRIDLTSGEEGNVSRVLAASDQPVSKGTAQRVAIPLERPELEDKDAAEATTAPPFSAGNYQCEVAIDGAPQAPVPFRISLAQCPASEIKDATFCLGFYKSGTKCRRYGDTSKEGASCTCEGSTKKWKCG